LDTEGDNCFWPVVAEFTCRGAFWSSCWRGNKYKCLGLGC